MKVIGIDVAPGKGGHICDGSLPLKRKSPAELNDYLQSLPDNVLIAWDAPLTGPPDPNDWKDCKDLTTRRIESFFKQPGEFRPPRGISVLSYCGCSHWTISRRLLGLPRVGPYDSKDKLPFKLVTNDRDRPSSQGRYVVEVHPAVALWRWCQKDYDGKWEYKTNKTCRGKLGKLMSRRIGRNLTDATDDKLSDDELDAWTAWYLAQCWLDRKGVTLLGSASTGSFLLPEEPELQKAFEQFLHNS